MAHGGRRVGAGRPEGARGKRTAALEERAIEAAAAIGLAIPGAFEGDAHAFLMAVYKDPQQPMDARIDAAKAAIRYEKPALASVDMVNHDVQYVVSGEPLSPEDRDRAWLEKFGGGVH